MSDLKGKKEKEAWGWRGGGDTTLYQTASVVLRELVDLDLGFIIMLILKKGDGEGKCSSLLINAHQLAFHKEGFEGSLPPGRLSPASAQCCRQQAGFLLSCPSPGLFRREFLLCLPCQQRNWILNRFSIWVTREASPGNGSLNLLFAIP